MSFDKCIFLLSTLPLRYRSFLSLCSLLINPHSKANLPKINKTNERMKVGLEISKTRNDNREEPSKPTVESLNTTKKIDKSLPRLIIIRIKRGGMSINLKDSKRFQGDIMNNVIQFFFFFNWVIVTFQCWC